ncbi:expansin EXLX1 family cellulose-binding protein [Actinoallomurus vinaceus]
MKATRQAARHRRRRLGLMMGTPLALIAAGVLSYLVMAFPSARKADAGNVAATPAAGTPMIVQPGPGSLTAAAGPTTAAAQPSAPRTRRTASTVAPLAGRIRPKVTYRGVATAYDAGNGGGACLYGPSGDLMIAAMNHTDYEASKACGAYVRVHAANGASITVRITNECPLPCAPGQLDLSKQAFAKLANPSLGRIPITWRLLSPRMSRTISIRYKTGSSRWWCGIQVIGHRNPVARLEVRSSNGWRRLPRTPYNYFISADGSGCGGAIRITDIYGERLTIKGIALRPNVAQPTRVQFARH